MNQLDDCDISAALARWPSSIRIDDDSFWANDGVLEYRGERLTRLSDAIVQHLSDDAAELQMLGIIRALLYTAATDALAAGESMVPIAAVDPQAVRSEFIDDFEGELAMVVALWPASVAIADAELREDGGAYFEQLALAHLEVSEAIAGREPASNLNWELFRALHRRAMAALGSPREIRPSAVSAHEILLHYSLPRTLRSLG